MTRPVEALLRIASTLLTLGVLGVLAALSSSCGGARSEVAELAFTRYARADSASVWVADADGSRARQLAAHGYAAMLSPDGRRVAYLVTAKGDVPVLYVRSVAGGEPRRIGRGFATWAPDGTHLAVSSGRLLYLVDVTTGERRRLPGGHVDLGGLSFAPDGTGLAYARGNGRTGLDYRSDLFALRLSDLEISRLTDDGHSDRPVWGRHWIVYRRFHFAGSWSIGRLHLMRPDGSHKRTLARGDERTSLARMGLEPLELSEDGRRLLACAAAEFSCAPVAITVPEGKQHKLRIQGGEAVQGESTEAADLARDGSEALVNVGPFDDPRNSRVYAIPFAGGKPRLIVRDATAGLFSWAH